MDYRSDPTVSISLETEMAGSQVVKKLILQKWKTIMPLHCLNGKEQCSIFLESGKNRKEKRFISASI